MAPEDLALQALIEQVRAARASQTALNITGGNTKAFYGETPQGLPLDITGLRGISSYEPSELVVTARAGTPLAELEAALAEQGQCLPFEPPRFSAGGTLGGTITGEHGVGVEKLSSMCVQFSPEEREQMFAVKRAFDAAGTLNPGKVIPTLHRCAEYGRMHV